MEEDCVLPQRLLTMGQEEEEDRSLDLTRPFPGLAELNSRLTRVSAGQCEIL